MLEGVYRGIEENWFQGEIAESAYRLEKRVTSGRQVVVGVNRFTDAGDDDPIETLHIPPEIEEKQKKRLAEVKQERNLDAVDAALRRLERDAAAPECNLMPAVLEAVHAYATLGEMVDTLAEVFGRWTETPTI